MMSRPNKQSMLVRRKTLLLNKIQQQRTELRQSSQNWLDVTAPYDKAWCMLVSLKPLILIGISFISFQGLKHPKKLIRWGERAVGAFGLIKTLRRSFKKTSH